MSRDSDYSGLQETEWRVIWFPADAPDRVFVGTEAAVRRRASREDVAEWNPLVERRVVIEHPWESA